MPDVRPRHLVRILALTAIALALLLVGGGPSEVGAQFGFEKIDAYRVDIRIETDGSLTVTEAIEYDFGSQQKHGIDRDIPTKLRYDDEHDRNYDLDVQSVTGSPGTPANYDVEGIEGGKTRIRIGDADKTITGQHSYQIVYRVKGALNGFPEHDELYWNAIGNDWALTIYKPEVTVHLAAPQAGDEVHVACFAGPLGSQLPCGDATTDGTQATFTNTWLGSYDGLTIVVGFPKGRVPEPMPILDTRWTFQRAFTVDPLRLVIVGALLVFVLAALARLVWVVGRDMRWSGSPVEVVFGKSGTQQRVPMFEGGAYAIEFTPPDDLRPGQIGTLVDEVAHPLDVSATIVDLATRGYLRIDEVEKKWFFGKSDWKLTKLPAPAADKRGLLGYEDKLLDGLFEDGDEVQLSDLSKKFSTRLAGVQQALYSDAVKRGWFHRSPDSTRGRWLGISIGLLVVAVALVVVVAKFTTYGIVPLPLVAGALVFVTQSHRMPRRTAKGTGALRRVLGFREFIESAETRRAEFAEKANLFYEYLPYAVVFGCADKWANAFDDLALEAPDWYRSTTPFTVAMLASSMDGFSTTTSGTLASTPGGSGGSGGGGGGSSGGGGGGGGGGSW